MINLNKTIFNQVYAKYAKKDYFANKGFIRSQQENRKLHFNKIIPFWELKKYLKMQKSKCFQMIKLRFLEFTIEGKIYPKREKFTHAIFKAHNLSIRNSI